MPFFSRNTNSPLSPTPQSTSSRFKISLSRLFRRSPDPHGPIPQVLPGVNLSAPEIMQMLPDLQYASGDDPHDIPKVLGTLHHGSFNPMGVQTKSYKPHPIDAQPVTVPVAAQFHGAQSINISGSSPFTNIGTNTGNVTMNNYGGTQATHGLEKLEIFVSFAALHDAAEQDPTCRCHPGTRKNVLSQLREWVDNPNATHSITWLHGPAGAGKSAIAQTIAHSYEEGEVAATFFFYRSDASRNDGNRLFPTLAWQLAFSIPAIKDSIVHVLDKTPHVPRKDVETQFKQLVAHPFHLTNNVASQLLHPAPIVIIDGLDECSDEQLQRRILTIIGNAVKDRHIPLRFLICSRPEALIKDVLDLYKDITLPIDLATLDDSNRDIEKYLVEQFSDIVSKRNFIFAATVIRYIGDEDYNPQDQLDIVRNLKPHGKISPFALLDELYLYILKRQRDQDFLKTFLALLVGRSSINSRDLREDDATLMNISKKDLHTKLRRMHSLLKLETFIEVHHKSFLDFLEDSSRSGEYHVSKQGGQKRYLELIVDYVVRHVSLAIEQPNNHEKCCSSPKFRSTIQGYPPMIMLPMEDWQQTLKSLLDLQNRLLSISKFRPCRIYQSMRELLLQWWVLQGNSHHIAQVPKTNANEPITGWSPTVLTEAGQSTAENDLDKWLSVLLSRLPGTNTELAVDTTIIKPMSSLLSFDCAEIAARVQSVADAQKLVDLIDLLINNGVYLNQCGRDAALKAAILASAIFARVPLLPHSVFLNSGPTREYDWFQDFTSSNFLEHDCQSVFISRILDHKRILLIWCLFRGDDLRLVYGNVNGPNESIDKWLQRSSLNFVTRIRVMLEVARTIQYIHSTDIGRLGSYMISLEHIALDSNLCVKVAFFGFFGWQINKEKWIYEDLPISDRFTNESNVSAFADLFQEVCFDGNNGGNPKNLVEDASRRLIERCHVEDLVKRPTIEDVLKEMETWDLG